MTAQAALGHLRAIDRHHETRPGQAAMVDAVASAIAERRDLGGEAGPSTGKALAYLLPALQSGQRVLVATATRQLQAQVVASELPLALAATGRQAHVAVLKGRANYVCVHRVQRALAAPPAEASVRSQLYRVAEFAQLSSTGDRSELDGVAEHSPVWPLVTSTVDNCLGAQCPAWSRCFVASARRRAAAADVVVVNHHLLLADHGVRERWPEGGLLHGFGVVVIDEAHALAETAAAFFGHAVSSRRTAALVDDLRSLCGLATPSGLCDTELLALLRRSVDRLQVTSAALWAAAAGALPMRVLQAADLARLIPIAADTDVALDRIQALVGDDQLAGDPAWSKAAETLYALRADLGACLPTTAGQDGRVRWIETRGAHLGLRCQPIDVADDLRRTLLADPAVRIWTSATLRTSGSFDHLLAQLGLPAETSSLSVPSPFDFARQCRLYVPHGLPAPFAPGRAAAVADHLCDLAMAAAGGVLALFSSMRALQEVTPLLRKALPFAVLAQGDAPKEQLLGEFVEHQPAVLAATLGFWHGVDLPAQAVRVVCLDKIPFPPPDDPLVQARGAQAAARGQRAFDAVSLPAAELTLRQGFGRLIRSQRHRGVVAVLDPRLLQSAYGSGLVAALPPAPVVRELAQVAAFLAEGVPVEIR